MKTILTSVVAGSILATLTLAQSTHGDRRSFDRYGTAHRKIGACAPTPESLLVYVITSGFQFGALDLQSGKFLPIGPGIPQDVGAGLVRGPRTSLLTLSFSGDLDAIDPSTGATSVVGATGLGDCSTPASPCGPNSANVLGRLDTTLYATDFGNNLYTVDPSTGATKLIGPTGIPAITFIPFSPNPDGTLNVYGESLFSAHGKLYANFGTATLDPATGIATPSIPGAIYEIDRATGRAKFLAPTDTNLTSIVTLNDTVYAFDAATGQVVTLDLRDGQTMPVSELDSAAALIAGATPARPIPADRR